MPQVRKNEDRNTYVSRCVKYVMQNEGLSQKAAVGRCEGMYSQYEKNKNKKSKGEEIIESATDILLEQMEKD